MTAPSGDFNRMGIVWIGRNPVGWIGSTSGNQPRAGDVTGTYSRAYDTAALQVGIQGRTSTPDDAAGQKQKCRVAPRVRLRWGGEQSTIAPHGIGKPTANRDLTPLATANGYRPADGWGVVIQA